MGRGTGVRSLQATARGSVRVTQRGRERGWRLGHRTGLDGLRGVAVLLVVACHVLDTWHVRFHALGAAGVCVFFTLSGFLITSLLVEERRSRGTVSFARFFRNRALRLFPALVVVALLVTAYEVVTGSGTLDMLAPVALYVANWATVLGTPLGYMAHAWSLSIEEQFYLVWPLALVVAWRWRNGPLVVALGGIAVSTTLRFALWDGDTGTRVHYGSDTQAAGLLIGCLLALLAHRGLRPVHAGWCAPLGIAALASIALVDSDYATAVLVPTVVPLVTAALIWVACSHAGGMLAQRWLRYVGQRSYGWYLWHFPLVMIVHAQIASPVAAVLAAVGALGVAELSWRWVEQPFLRLKAAPVRSAPAPSARVPAAAADLELSGAGTPRGRTARS
ncbi:MAG: acyltransferase family protein [Marmoricola sp.]